MVHSIYIHDRSVISTESNPINVSSGYWVHTYAFSFDCSCILEFGSTFKPQGTIFINTELQQNKFSMHSTQILLWAKRI